jgi:hypothetical protein
MSQQRKEGSSVNVRTVDVTPNWPTLVRFFGADCDRNLRGATQKCVGVAILPGEGGIRTLVRSGHAPNYKFVTYTKVEGRWMRAWDQREWDDEVKGLTYIWGEVDHGTPRMTAWEYAEVDFGGPGPENHG